MGLSHGDLHSGNMVWNKGRVIPIDFDDCGYGLKLYDLAVYLAESSHYFKKVGKVESRAAKAAMLEGYGEFTDFSEEDLIILPYLIVARDLAMMGWLFDRRDNPELLAHLRKNLAKRLKLAEKNTQLADKGVYFA